jgi:membrane protease YdiL (CAAX protease family)
MLFTIKNHAGLSLAAAVLAAAAAVAAAAVLGLEWRWWPGVPTGLLALWFAAAVLLLAASDGILHGLLLVAWRGYRPRYRRLVLYFRRQGAPAILAGSLLAGVEELWFRGIVLEGLLTRGFPAAAAVALAAGLFGLLHLIPDRRLAPFALWAVWEGALLGAIYVYTGSLLLAALTHIAHDLAGFSLFALQRRTGWLLPEP